MLLYRKGKNKGASLINPVNAGTKSAGYIVPSPWFVEATPPNNIPRFPWQSGSGFWTRTGDHMYHDAGAGTSGAFGMDRPNHYEVTSVNEKIPVWEYLNGRFTVTNVNYRSTSGVGSSLQNLVVPISRRASQSGIGSRFPYSSVYAPLYAAFRYIAWDPNANGGQGQIISGPLSKVIKVSHEQFPFNYSFTNFAGAATCTTVWSGTSGGPIEGPNSQLKCWIETRLP
jgi:hypothetical protein